jgi:hypothetical protein
MPQELPESKGKIPNERHRASNAEFVGVGEAIPVPILHTGKWLIINNLTNQAFPESARS